VLTEELSPKMTLEVALGLFELYLTLADIQRFWSSIPGRWVPCPTCPPVSSWRALCAVSPGPLQAGNLGHVGSRCLIRVSADGPPTAGTAVPSPWPASMPHSCLL